MRFFRYGLLCSAVALIAAPLVACDSDTSGVPPTGMEVQIYTAPQASDPFEGVSFIRLVMEGGGLEGAYSQLIPYEAGASATLDGVPFSGVGQARQLTVEGWASGDSGQPTVLVSRGRAVPVEVLEGQSAASMDVLLARVNHFQDLVNVDTLSTQALGAGRLGHTVTSTDNGETIIAGGAAVAAAGAEWWKPTGFDTLVGSVESLDRRSYLISGRSPMLEARAYHASVPLSSGQIIMAGGYVSSGSATKNVELYNPPGVLDGTAKPLQPMAVARAGHTATLIDEAKRTILFVGGDDAGTWELWDPVDGTQGTRPLPDSLTRRFHTATRFQVADRVEPAVLIAGGETDLDVHATAMLYDSVAQNLVPVSESLPSGGRSALTATMVDARGFIYLAGGFTNVARTAASSGIDVFSIESQGFIQGNEGFRMRTGRGGHSAALLPNNTVVLAGGVGVEGADPNPRPLASIEVIYEFLDAGAGVLKIEVASSFNPEATAAVVPFMLVERVGQHALSLDNGMALLIGGAAVNQASGGFTMVPNLTLYNPL